MTVPAAGKFGIVAFGTPGLKCPECGHRCFPEGEELTIRDLIAAASDHAQTHARKQVNT